MANETHSSIGPLIKMAHYLMPNHWKARRFSNEWHAFVEDNDRRWNSGRYNPEEGTGPEAYDRDHSQMEAHLDDLYTYEGQCWWMWNQFIKVMKGRPVSALELGSGSGFFSQKIIPSCNHLELHDINPHLLNFASERLKKGGFDHFSLNSSDLYKFSSERKFDVIISFGTLHHLNRRAIILEQLAAYLNDPGYFLIVEPTHNFKRVVRIFYKASTRYLWDGSDLVTHDFLTFSEIRHWRKVLGERLRPKSVEVLDLHSFAFPGSMKMGAATGIPAVKFERVMQRVPLLRAQGGRLASLIQVSTSRS